MRAGTRARPRIIGTRSNAKSPGLVGSPGLLFLRPKEAKEWSPQENGCRRARGKVLNSPSMGPGRDLIHLYPPPLPGVNQNYPSSPVVLICANFRRFLAYEKHAQLFEIIGRCGRI